MTWGAKHGADILADIARLIGEIPIRPLFASCCLFPADKAHSFTHDGREYLIAHPVFWKKIPVANKPVSAWGGIEIVDIDLSANAHRRADVLGAYAAVLSKAANSN